MRILIVDDLEDNRELYATYFEIEGHHVEQAVDGEDGLAHVAASPPDVIVMDLAMPKLDGWEATRRLKGNPRTREIPVIVVTASDHEVDLERAREAGADAIVKKPCVPRDLAKVIDRVLTRR